MILLLGGTAETAAVARELVARDYVLLVSTATDQPLDLPPSPRLSRRCGPLDAEALAALLRQRRIAAVVDVTHPYAEEITRLARDVCRSESTPYFRYERPAVCDPTDSVLPAATHEDAARLAFAQGKPVLLTIGANHVGVYAAEAVRSAVPCYARVLPRDASVRACEAAGLLPEAILAARGPFSVEENVETIRRYGIGVLVTKDSGAAGGVPEKLDAARQTGCAVVLVARPADEAQDAYADWQTLVDALPPPADA